MAAQLHQPVLRLLPNYCTYGGTPAVVHIRKGSTPEDELGDGQPYWEGLQGDYDDVSNAIRQEL